MGRLFTYVCHFWKFKNHRRIEVIKYGGAKIQNKSLFATAIEARRMRNFVKEWQWNAIKRLQWYFASIGGTMVLKVGGQQCLLFSVPESAYDKWSKTTCVLIFYIIYCCRRLLSWYRQLCSIDITIIAQKRTLRISPPKLPCPGTAPVAAINSKFSGNMPRFIWGKVRKFQDPNSSRLGHISEKPDGWIKTTSPCH